MTAALWTIAGHDPFGGAGLQADMRVAAALRIPLRSIMSAFTAQNDRQVFAVEALPSAWLDQQWNALAAAERPACVKIGLIKDAFTVLTLAERLTSYPRCPVVLDPILRASSGNRLIAHDMLDALRVHLLAQVTVLTPNRPEAETLVGFPISSYQDLSRAAEALRAMGPKAVLIKGGHSEGSSVLDYFDDGDRPFFLKAQRQAGDYRGTGCALSTAIACYLVQGMNLRDATVAAHAYVQAAIRESHRLGWQHLPSVPDLPTLTELAYFDQKAFLETQGPFAPMDDTPLGFYPVVPSLEWVERLAATGLKTLQIRIKDPLLRARAVPEAQRICAAHGVRLFVNDDWRLAIQHQVYGVHLGQEDLDLLSVEDLGTLRASGLRLGISTHSLEEAARAANLHPSYIALGPIFPTTCKSMAFGPQGMQRIQEWKIRLPHIPLVAIGGLKREHAALALAHGADGIAVVSALTEHPHPEQELREWLKYF